MAITFEEARAGRRARMIPKAAARADVLGAAASAACEALAGAPLERAHAALAELGRTGVGYDEWCTTVETEPASRAFAGVDDLRRALASKEPRALAVALGLLAHVDPTRTYALVRAALPLDDTDFAPNYLESYIQASLAATLDRVVGAPPPDDFAEMFAAGRLALEKIPAGWVARLSVDQVAGAARGSDLGYVHRDEAGAFLSRHPAWSDGEQLAALYRALGVATSHAALAFGSCVVDRLIELRHEPAGAAAAEIHAATADAEAGPRSLLAQDAFRLVVALRHRPTLERVFAELDLRARGRRLRFDPHHTRPELRAPIAAGFAIDPASASSRFAAWLAPRAVASEHGAAIAHDVLRAGQGLMSDHDGTRLATGHGAFFDADPGWREVLGALLDHPRLGPLARAALSPLSRRSSRAATAKGAPKEVSAPKEPKSAPKRAKKSAPKRAKSARKDASAPKPKRR